MKPMYDATLECFPESFRLLQKEAFLSNSCILSGFNFLIKGNFIDTYLGAYYAAFFHLTIGIERLLKLVYVSDYMMKNRMNFPSEKEIKKFGHKIDVLIKECGNICITYGVNNKILDNIDENIITFLTSFADAKEGRYFNFLGKYQEKNPLWKWQNICMDVLNTDIAAKSKIIKEQLNLMKDVTIDDDMKAYYIFPPLCSKSNHYVVLRIIKILEQFTRVLGHISTIHHEYDVQNRVNNYPSIPYFDEIFKFTYLPKDYILRKKRWTDYVVD